MNHDINDVICNIINNNDICNVYIKIVIIQKNKKKAVVIIKK